MLLRRVPQLEAQDEGMRQPPSSNRQTPASIAALASMKDEVHPITTDERGARIDRAQQLMAQSRMDAIFLAGGTSLRYFTNVGWGNSERVFAVVIPKKGQAFAVCPSFEEDRAREQLNLGPLGNAEVLTWHEDDNPYSLVARGLRARGIAAGILGIEERTPDVFREGVAHAAPTLKLESATPITAGCRRIKTAHELELMTIANQATLKVYEAVYKALQPGMSQNDAGALISAAYRRVGFNGFASVQVGEFTALPHGSAQPQLIREGTIIMVDDGCSVDGYQSDITRTFVLGQPADKMKTVFDIVHRAQAAALAAARPGAEAQSVDAAARKVIVEAGYGPDYRYFSHRLGHGIGMDGHEWPYLVRGNTLKLEPNMCFSDEPGVYIRGEFGVRLEDDMHITEDGAKLFTPQSPSLEQPFG
ncbi:MAG: aminopeptidase P family protein [Acidobacteria bacterium]|nr:aminopeptidase P family protein [Acidobacteriota bacterium]